VPRSSSSAPHSRAKGHDLQQKGRREGRELTGTIAGCELTGGAFLTILDKVSLFLQEMNLLFLERSLNLGHPIADQAADTQCFFTVEKDLLHAEGFRAAASEHSPEGCVSQDSCRLCSRGCSRVPRAVVQSRVPAVPQGLCAGAGTAACQAQHSACPGSCTTGDFA